jgi:hypothetical protein
MSKLAKRVLTKIEPWYKVYRKIFPSSSFWSLSKWYGGLVVRFLLGVEGTSLKFFNRLIKQAESPTMELIWEMLRFLIAVDIPFVVFAACTIYWCLLLIAFLVERNASKGQKESTERIDGLESDIQSVAEKIESAKFKITPEWFSERAAIAIADLDKRYTPELNVDLPIAKIFEGIGRTDKYIEELRASGDLLLKEARRMHYTFERVNVDQALVPFLSAIEQTILDFSLEGIEDYDFDSFEGSLNAFRDEIFNQIDSVGKEDGTHKSKLTNDEEWSIQNLVKLKLYVNDLIRLVESPSTKLINSPFLVLVGEAGTGKSHLLGDIVSKRQTEGRESILILGQHLVGPDDVRTQILRNLGVNIPFSELLNQLNERAKSKGSRIVLFIDAINEGDGFKIWKNTIRGFIEEIKGYEWLGLVVSIRTTYHDRLVGDSNLYDLGVIRQVHVGFGLSTFEAISIYFRNYGIELPTIPLLNDEFSNPLLLKLFCEGLKNRNLTRVPEGTYKVSRIMGLFVSSINERLSSPDNYDYDVAIPVVDRVLQELVKHMAQNDLTYVPYSVAYDLVYNVASKYMSAPHKFLESLISEGALSKNLIPSYFNPTEEDPEAVYIAYQRFADYYHAKWIIENHDDLKGAFGLDGPLNNLIKDPYVIGKYTGVINELAVQLPENGKGEIYELFSFDDDYSREFTTTSLFYSLEWRRIDTIDLSIMDYIKEEVNKDHSRTMYNVFLEVLLKVGVVPSHPMNADFLHDHLMGKSMALRDASWTVFINYQSEEDDENESIVYRMIYWALNTDQRATISDESLRLFCICMAWSLTSSNRRIRDLTTKAMIAALNKAPHVLIQVLKSFENCDDPYVRERLFCVAFGCALNAKAGDDLAGLCEYIYASVFDQDEVFPHILLRCYACSTIDYACRIGYKPKFDIGKTQPPYKSEKIELQDRSFVEVREKYFIGYDDDSMERHQRTINPILSSMQTDRGSTGMYGDFGRYVFKTALDGFKINPSILSAKAVEWIVGKYGYDPELHGRHDMYISGGRARQSNLERIGKKYQWIALHEMAARLTDHEDMYERFHSDQKVEYQGSWEPGLRDIDPSLRIQEKKGSIPGPEQVSWWNKVRHDRFHLPHEDWLKEESHLPLPTELIEVVDDEGVSWIALHGFPEWAEERELGKEQYDYAHKRLWCHFRGYLVKQDQYEDVHEQLSQHWIWRHDLPEHSSQYTIFKGEYFNSRAYEAHATEYYGLNEWVTISSQDTGVEAGSISLASNQYYWEASPDASKESSIAFGIPGKILKEGLKLIASSRDGYFIDDNDEIVAFDPSVEHKCYQYCLIRKDVLCAYLKQHNLRLIWIVIGEKQVIGGNRNAFIGRLKMSGLFTLTQSQSLEGKVEARFKGPNSDG